MNRYLLGISVGRGKDRSFQFHHIFRKKKSVTMSSASENLHNMSKNLMEFGKVEVTDKNSFVSRLEIEAKLE